jgi:hypothetical protein
MSGDGVNPKKWGPAKWKDEEQRTEALPDTFVEDERKALLAQLKHLKRLGLWLPCQMCRTHYVEHSRRVCKHFASHDMPMNDTVTRARIHHFIWFLHDCVNKQNGRSKPYRQRYSWEWYKSKYPGANGPLTNTQLANHCRGRPGMTADAIERLNHGGMNNSACMAFQCPAPRTTTVNDRDAMATMPVPPTTMLL